MDNSACSPKGERGGGRAGLPSGPLDEHINGLKAQWKQTSYLSGSGLHAALTPRPATPPPLTFPVRSFRAMSVSSVGPAVCGVVCCSRPCVTACGSAEFGSSAHAWTGPGGEPRRHDRGARAGTRSEAGDPGEQRCESHLAVCLYLYPSLCTCLSVSVSVCPSVYVCFCFYLSVSRCQYLSVGVCICLCLYLSLCWCQYLSVCRCLYLSVYS